MPRLAKSERERRLFDFEARLRDRIFRNGYTLKSFTEKTGIPRSSFYHLLRNYEEFTVGQIYTMSNLLNVTPESLILCNERKEDTP